MKKSYIAPQSKVISLGPVQLICNSLGMSSASQDNTDALSRGSSFSFDEDNDDY